MNRADLEKPLGVEVGAVTSNEQFPLGQFITAFWRMQRDSIQHSNKLAYLPRNVLQTMSIHKGISLFLHVEPVLPLRALWFR